MRYGLFPIILLCLAGVLYGAPAETQEEIEQKMLGTWLGSSGDWGRERPAEESNFNFMTNRQFKALIGTDTAQGTYTIDITKNPYHIDFTLERDGKEVTLFSIFDFPKKKHIRIAEWDSIWRPKAFRPGITFEEKPPASGLPDSFFVPLYMYKSEIDSPHRGMPKEEHWRKKVVELEYNNQEYYVLIFTIGDGGTTKQIGVYTIGRNDDYYRIAYAKSWKARELDAEVDADGMLELREKGSSQLKGKVILSCNLNSIGTEQSTK